MISEIENISKISELSGNEIKNELHEGFQESNVIIDNTTDNSLDLAETLSCFSFESNTFTTELDEQEVRNDNSDRHDNESFDFNHEYDATDNKVNSNYQATENTLAQVDKKEVRSSCSLLDELKSSKLLNKILADKDNRLLDGIKTEPKYAQEKILQKQANLSSSFETFHNKDNLKSKDSENNLAKRDTHLARNSGCIFDELKSSTLLNKIYPEKYKSNLMTGSMNVASAYSSSDLIKANLKDMSKFVGKYYLHIY